MIYPVKNFKTEWNNSAGYDHGDKTPYGLHDGKDINDNNGGNSDLGKHLYAIADGETIGIHEHSGPGNFGKHFFLKIDGPWGTRYVHYAHCQEIFVKLGEKVKEGDIIATVGNTGTEYAHCHFAIKKKANGMDTIAFSIAALDDAWEDPIAFIEQYMTGGDNMADQQTTQTTIDQLREQRDRNWNLYTQVKKEADEIRKARDDNWNGLQAALQRVKALETEVAELKQRPVSCPPSGDPKLTEKMEKIKILVANDPMAKISNILAE